MSLHTEHAVGAGKASWRGSDRRNLLNRSGTAAVASSCLLSLSGLPQCGGNTYYKRVNSIYE